MLLKKRFTCTVGLLLCQLAAVTNCASFNRNFSSARNMQAIRNDGLGGRGVTFIPRSGSYRNVVVWMHGLGDTADGWAALMPTLGLVDTKFVLPTAKTRPISVNGGMPMPGWSDILGLEPSSREDRVGFTESADRINKIIQQEVDNGIDSTRIVVAGFSQGGALALHVSLRSSHQLGGCIALSTWLPLKDDYPRVLSPSAKSLKILQIHGDEDLVVSHAWGKGSHQELTKIVPSPEFITIEGMGHSSDPDETAAVTKFLKNIFQQQ